MRKITLTLPYVENPSTGLERLAEKIMDESIDSDVYQQELWAILNVLNKIDDAPLADAFGLILEVSGEHKTRKVILPPARVFTIPSSLPEEEKKALLDKIVEEQRLQGLQALQESE